MSAVVAHFFVSAIGRTLARAGDSTRFSAAPSTFSHRKERDPIEARARATRAGRCTLLPDLDDADRSTLNTAPGHDLLSHSGRTIPAYRSLCMRHDLEEGGIDSFAPCVGSERTVESTRASFQNYRIGDCPDRATDRPRGNHKGALLNALRTRFDSALTADDRSDSWTSACAAVHDALSQSPNTRLLHDPPSLR